MFRVDDYINLFALDDYDLKKDDGVRRRISLERNFFFFSFEKQHLLKALCNTVFIRI